MHRARVSDKSDGHLSFDLEDLVRPVENRARESDWLCLVAEAIPKANGPEALEEAFADQALTPGADFLELAKQTRQVIDGKFEAFREGESEPWLVLEAVDSSFWLVHAKAESDLQLVTAPFREVACE